MKITRRDIANYKLLKVLLERDQRKLDRYIAKQPSTYSGKVYGSNPNFPYEARYSLLIHATRLRICRLS